jgi:hypothetical protein
MLGFGIQVNNGGAHAGPAGLWAPLLLIVAGAVVGGRAGAPRFGAGARGGAGSRPPPASSAGRGR